ncbi:MAG: efflux RND transporter periplasmic adaptor subunit [Arcobacteraceae bacterium]|nr:efflux RND transporter periplasmic adaptor subunit [Arcobacteraceae bacterium]
MKKILILISVALISFAMGGQVSLVNTTTVKKGTVNPLEEFIGTVKFSKNSKIASQSSGAVIKINFEAGDKVKKGDILVKIDSDILDSQIKSAKALFEIAKITLENASKDYDRYKGLISKKSISQKIYDDSFFKVNSAKQNLNFAKASLDELLIQKTKKVIKAPFSGIIIEKNTEISQWLNSGNTVATLVDANNIDLIFNLPTSYIYKLNKKENYEIDLGVKKINSKLYASIAKGDKLTRTFPVKFKATVDNYFLYDGMEAKIKLPRNKKVETLIVPRDAVIKRFGQDVVFIVNDKSMAIMIPAQIIGYKGKVVAVFAKGLKEGMDIVIKGNERIFPNSPVKIINK